MSEEDKDEFMDQEENPDDWAQNSDGWDSDPEEPDPNEIKPIVKNESSGVEEIIKENKFYQSIEISTKRIPQQIKKLDQTLCLKNDDKLIAILRYFKWNINKVNEEYYEDIEKLES